MFDVDLDKYIVKRTLKDYYDEKVEVFKLLAFNDISIDQLEDMMETLDDEYALKLEKLLKKKP